MKRLLVLSFLFAGLTLLAPVFAATEKEQATIKKALQRFNDFIGDYKGAAGPDKFRFDPKLGWQEKIGFSWKFKKDDMWITMTFKDSKLFKSGDIHYNLKSKKYDVEMTTADGKKEPFVGEFDEDGEYFTMEYTDPKTKDVRRIKMNMAGEGARMIYRVSKKPGNRTIYSKEFMVACTKEGESFAGGKKKPKCVVTGGVGTSTVSFKGKTYYVCCSGCRDAFNENPEKFIKEFEKSK